MCVYEYVCVCVCVHRKRRAGCKEKEDADATLGFFTGHFSSLQSVNHIESLPTPSSQ